MLTSLDIKEPGLNVLPLGVERYIVNGGGLTGVQILPEDEIEIINDEGNQICEISVFDKDGKSELAILNLKEQKKSYEIKKILSKKDESSLTAAYQLKKRNLDIDKSKSAIIFDKDTNGKIIRNSSINIKGNQFILDGDSDTIIEATSGNTGIALAMVCAIIGYILILIMPDNMSIERRAAMSAYGANITLVTEQEGMEGARDLALKMQSEKKGYVLNQFANEDNLEAHVSTTGPEIWKDTDGKVTHFVASMGTTGTIVGTAKYLKSMNPEIKIIGVQPEEGSSIPGIRKWPKEYIPKIYDEKNIDEIVYIKQKEAENMTRELAKKEGIFSGPSSGGTTLVALEVAKKANNAIIVSIICDRGDRYISTGTIRSQPLTTEYE